MLKVGLRISIRPDQMNFGDDELSSRLSRLRFARHAQRDPNRGQQQALLLVLSGPRLVTARAVDSAVEIGRGSNAA